MNDVEIKKDMYKEFENKDSFINIKEELFKSMNNLKDEDLTHSNTFRLEDTMSAIVINHYKMDPHCHNEKVFNINDKQLKLKKLYSFTYQDTLYTIFDIFKKEISLFYNVQIQECYIENILFSSFFSIISKFSKIFCKNSKDFGLFKYFELLYKNVGKSSSLKHEVFEIL